MMEPDHARATQITAGLGTLDSSTQVAVISDKVQIAATPDFWLTTDIRIYTEYVEYTEYILTNIDTYWQLSPVSDQNSFFVGKAMSIFKRQRKPAAVCSAVNRVWGPQSI